MRRLWIPVALAVSLVACDTKSPIEPQPTNTPTPTRLIAVVGSLAFGDVAIGSFVDLPWIIRNNGNSPLTVTSITVPGGGVYSASFTNGTIGAGTERSLTVRCTPTSAASFNGTITVVSNATAGTSSQAISCTGVNTGPLFTMSGKGDTVFNIPAAVGKVRITGHFVDTGSTSNFVVRFKGSLIINEILRNADYDGIHLTTGGGQIEITSSASIQWTFTEVR